MVITGIQSLILNSKPQEIPKIKYQKWNPSLFHPHDSPTSRTFPCDWRKILSSHHMEVLLEVLYTTAHIVQPFEIALKKFTVITFLTTLPAACVGCHEPAEDKLATGKGGNPAWNATPRRNKIQWLC